MESNMKLLLHTKCDQFGFDFYYAKSPPRTLLFRVRAPIAKGGKGIGVMKLMNPSVYNDS